MKTYKQIQSEILAAVKEAEEIIGLPFPGNNARAIYDYAVIYTNKNNQMIGDAEIPVYSSYRWERCVYAKKRRNLMYFVRIIIADRYSIMTIDQAKEFVNRK